MIRLKSIKKRQYGVTLPQLLLLIVCLLVTASLGAMAYLRFGVWGVLVFLLLVSILILVFLFFYFIIKWLRSRKKAKFEKELVEAQVEESQKLDPAEQMRIDELKGKFTSGIQTLKDAGKDLTKMPLYVMVGEPGAGKTEAIRHSSIRFPQGLNDLLQGTGGTYSMDWWFTNDAIILDTAGAILLEDSSNARFDAFLNQLKEYRKDYPITGLTLAIPADSLLIDDEVEIEAKAKRLFEQFSHIQTTLDLRFPVYLLITKSDLITGFREFFDVKGQEAFHSQMLGWSNAESLDSDFSATAIELAFRPIVERLKSMRLKLLGEIQTVEKHRIVDTDALYAFPDKFEELIPRIQKYLSVLFEHDDWGNKKPPFFRGLYFTSSMRQGAAIDSELAAALNVPVSQLPTTGLYQTDKSLFLKDFFLEKLLRERGLVTRMTNIAAGLRNRLLRFYLITAGATALLLFMGWYAGSSLSKKMRADKKRWSLATTYWDNGTFFPLINSSKESKYEGRELVPESSKTRLEYYQSISEGVGKPLGWGWYFSPLPAYQELKDDRRRAQIVLVEGSLVKPLLESARKVLQNSGKAAASEREINAGLALTKLEALLEKGERFNKRSTVREVFEPLLQLTNPELFPDGNASAENKDGEKLLQLIYEAYDRLDDSYTDRLRWMSEGAPYASISKMVRLFANHKDLIDRRDTANAETAEYQQELLAEFETYESELWQLVLDADDFNRIETKLVSLTKVAEKLDLVAAPSGSAITRKRYYEVQEKLQEMLADLPQALQTKVEAGLSRFELADQNWVQREGQVEQLDAKEEKTYLIKNYLSPADDGDALYKKKLKSYLEHYPLTDDKHRLWSVVSDLSPGELNGRMMVIEERVKERVARLSPFPPAPNVVPEPKEGEEVSNPAQRKKEWLELQARLKESSENGKNICIYLDRGTEEWLKAKLLGEKFKNALLSQSALIFRQPFGSKSPSLNPAGDLERAARVINSIAEDFRSCDSFSATSRHYKLISALKLTRNSGDGKIRTMRDKFGVLQRYKNAVVDEGNAVRSVDCVLGPFFLPAHVTEKRSFTLKPPFFKKKTIEIQRGVKAVRVGKTIAQAEILEPGKAPKPLSQPLLLSEAVAVQIEMHAEDGGDKQTRNSGGNWGLLNWIYNNTDSSYSGGTSRSLNLIESSGLRLTLTFNFPVSLPKRSGRLSGF